MLDKIFDFMFSSGALQFLGAFLWGTASVLLSPCGISEIPLVVGYIANSEDISRPRAFFISCAFCLGIIFNLALVALIISGLGEILSGCEKFLTLFTACVFIIMGLHMMGIIRVKFFALGSGGTGKEKQNFFGAVFLGIISGLAVGPCNIAYISPVISLAMSKNSPAIIFAYALGYCAVLVCAGTFTQIFSRFLEDEKFSRVINILCGVALIFGGLYFIHEAVII